MKSTLLRTLKLEYDVIEIHYNERLKNNPYLIRVFSYNSSDPTELRAEENEVKDLYRFLKRNNVL